MSYVSVSSTHVVEEVVDVSSDDGVEEEDSVPPLPLSSLPLPHTLSHSLLDPVMVIQEQKWETGTYTVED